METLLLQMKDRGHTLNLKSLGFSPDLGTYASRVLLGTSISETLDLQNGRMIPKFLDGFKKQGRNCV